jgi:hypothetical protein
MPAPESSNDISTRLLATIADLTRNSLALQLHFFLEVSAACLGLVSASPERPGDDVGGLDALLRELDRDTTDFLNRPADQERRLLGGYGGAFLSGAASA